MRIYVDFNSLDDYGRVVINLTVSDVSPDVLREGMPVVLYDEVIEVQAALKERDQFGMWTALPDWNTKHEIK
jgi:hypothetical protein